MEEQLAAVENAQQIPSKPQLEILPVFPALMVSQLMEKQEEHHAVSVTSHIYVCCKYFELSFWMRRFQFLSGKDKKLNSSISFLAMDDARHTNKTFSLCSGKGINLGAVLGGTLGALLIILVLVLVMLAYCYW